MKKFFKMAIVAGLTGAGAVTLIHFFNKKPNAKTDSVMTDEMTVFSLEEDKAEVDESEVDLCIDDDSKGSKLSQEEIEKVKEKLINGPTVMKVARHYHLTRREAYAIKRMTKEDNGTVA